MVTYMTAPRFKVVAGTTNLESEAAMSGTITRIENGFDTATLFFEDYQCRYFPAVITEGTAIEVHFKEKGGSYTEVFDGVAHIAVPTTEKAHMLKVKCDGAGYGFDATVCKEQYGAKSKNYGEDTIEEILTHASVGIITKYVNFLLGSATASGYSYTTEIETIAGTINYLEFPYKKNSKCIDDVCDLVTAIKDGAAGPHWRVNVSDKFLLKSINADLTDGAIHYWDQYYGGTQATSTLVENVDFQRFQFQKLGSEANYIIYYGRLLKPTGEAWTEGSTCDTVYWTVTGNWSISDDNVQNLVGDYCIDVDVPQLGVGTCRVPQANQSWNIENWGGEYNIPSISLYAKYGAAVVGCVVELHTTNAANYFYSPSVCGAATWEHSEFPIGPYHKIALDRAGSAWQGWLTNGAPDWADIDYVELAIVSNAGGNSNLYIDQLQLNGWVARAATRDYGATPFSASNPLKMKTIVDDVGKDDSGVATDDTGTIASLAYSEFLRLSGTPIVGQLTTPMIRDLTPGQKVHIHAKANAAGTFQIDTDMRVTKLVHTFSGGDQGGFFTTLHVTDDVTNTHARTRYDDVNKVLADSRPQDQERQSNSMKAKTVDITQVLLETQY